MMIIVIINLSDTHQQCKWIARPLPQVHTVESGTECSHVQPRNTLNLQNTNVKHNTSEKKQTSHNSAKYNYLDNNNDRLTAFDPGQPG